MKGISLVELLMTLVIVSIIMASIYNVLHHILAAHSHVEAEAEVVQNGRMAIERLCREVRQAAQFITTCTATTIIFGIDKSEPGDGDVIDIGDIQIQYRLSLGNLQRRERVIPALWPAWGDDKNIANYVTGFALTYRDSSNNILPPPLNIAAEVNAIRLVNVDISLETQRKGGAETHPVSLRATMHTRNR
jgi:prepilin-type N-terminal cleavage/methylation domain-containing protein